MRASALLGAGLLTLGVLAGGCSSQPAPKAASPTPSASATPYDQLDTTSLTLSRDAFCSAVPTDAVRTAIGGRATSRQAWRNGEKAQVEDDVSDVVHEDGCRWSRDATSAGAWVFASPLTTDQAAQVVRDGASQPGCHAAATTFGSPSQRQVCRLADGSHRARIGGLFGDTWLGCEVTEPTGVAPADVRTRAEAWCVQVANAVSADR